MTIANTHARHVCACGTVVRSCRCPGPHVEVRVVCEACQLAAAAPKMVPEPRHVCANVPVRPTEPVCEACQLASAEPQPAPGAPHMTREEFIVRYDLGYAVLAGMFVVRCGCGSSCCRGWQAHAPGQAPLYPVPAE